GGILTRRYLGSSRSVEVGFPARGIDPGAPSLARTESVGFWARIVPLIRHIPRAGNETEVASLSNGWPIPEGEWPTDLPQQRAKISALGVAPGIARTFDRRLIPKVLGNPRCPSD